jgi:hypothetical protein
MTTSTKMEVEMETGNELIVEKEITDKNDVKKTYCKPTYIDQFDTTYSDEIRELYIHLYENYNLNGFLNTSKAADFQNIIMDCMLVHEKQEVQTSLDDNDSDH